MKFRLLVRVGPRTWWEDHDRPDVKDEDDARAWAERRMEKFNHGARLPEEPAGSKYGKVLDVEVVNGRNEEDDW